MARKTTIRRRIKGIWKKTKTLNEGNDRKLQIKKVQRQKDAN